MPRKVWDVGDVIPLRATYRDAAKALVDPTTVTLAIKEPGADTSYPVVVSHPSTGVYTADVPITQSGRWWFGWTSTGTPAEYSEDYFDVRERRVPPLP